MRIGNLPFRVDGVLASKGQSSVGQDQDDIIFAPYTTVQRKNTGNHLAADHQRLRCLSARVPRRGCPDYQFAARAASTAARH